MRLLTPPGVFSPISDSWLLAGWVRRESPGARVLDLCTGSGAVALSAARAGAASVTAIDCSRRAVATAQLNARLNGVRVRALRGDLFGPVAGERFDVIASNPPYVPAATDELPTRGLERAWDAGRSGRVLLDRICAEAPRHLAPGGVLLLTHSTIIGEDQTLQALRDAGLDAEVVEREPGPLGPLMEARVAELEARGLLEPGVRSEEVLIFRGRRPRFRPAEPDRAVAAGAIALR